MNFQTTSCRCSKSYGSLTRATRLKVTPNMADPTSIKHSVSNLKQNFTLPFRFTPGHVDSTSYADNGQYLAGGGS